MNRKIVLLINPPNSVSIQEEKARKTGVPSEHSDWSNYPALGILTLASALKAVPNARPIYMDAVAFPLAEIFDFISAHTGQIAIVAVSALTDTYQAALKILEYSRQTDPGIIHVMGNDHFSALSELCFRNRPTLIDFGFIGNEVVTGFQRLVDHIVNDSSSSLAASPGLVFRESNHTYRVPEQAEPLFTEIDYSIMDDVFPHTSVYGSYFSKTFPARIKQWCGRSVHQGMTIEIARGCIKFMHDDACSFCSIQHSGVWRNSVTDAKSAWNVVRHAYEAGYDYIYVTADELTLTFPQLLKEMLANMPEWLLSKPEDERPVLTGYARADGLSKEKNVRMLYDLGFRVIMTGIDAGPMISLRALNKPFSRKNVMFSIEHLYDANRKAFAHASRIGLKLKVGFVLGHLGMTHELLKENEAYFNALLDERSDTICTADIEILSPEPGSRDYQYLVNPSFASQQAEHCGLEISPLDLRERIAQRWREQDIVDREQLMQDYVLAFMPELSLDDLIRVRQNMRNSCRAKGVLIGEG